jgi:transcriptional regulator of acetoin/glycerol metabolism
LPEVTRARLSPESGPKSTPRPATPPGNLKAHKDTEKDRILRALEKCGWNRLQAAKACGIPRRTFYRRLREYGIQE